jgi:hypothetical protein
MSQWGIAVERFAILGFRSFLANARLQSGVVDSVESGFKIRGGGCPIGGEYGGDASAVLVAAYTGPWHIRLQD